MKLMQFLMGLNDKFFAVRSSILMIVPLPSVMTAFNLVSQEESHKSISSRPSVEKSTAVFTANKTFKRYKTKNLNLKYTHCGGQGHLVERCFKLIGFLRSVISLREKLINLAIVLKELNLNRISLLICLLV